MRQQLGRQGGPSGEHPGAIGSEAATWAACALNSFSTLADEHSGQATGSPLRTSCSNSVSHSGQRYSKMGIGFLRQSRPAFTPGVQNYEL